ncbi:MAG: hypothetical protein R3E79_02830 [Caldilineaceae bacterium]
MPALYRPHNYLQQRWPVWLGNSDIGSRAVLLAFFEEFAYTGQKRTDPADR